MAVTNYSGYNPVTGTVRWDGGGYSTAVGNYTISGPTASFAGTPIPTATPTTSGSTSGTVVNYNIDNSQQEAYYAYLKAQAEAQRNAEIAQMRTFFDTYGLSSLWEGARSYLTQGYTDPNVISVMLSNNPTYQEAYYARFPAVKLVREVNKTRTAQGLPPIAEPTPATYVELERGYRQALQGLPDGLWGSPDDMAQWIAGEVSPQEIADRVNVAKNYINYQANSFVKDALRQVYGLTDAEMVSYVLDDKRTSEFVETEYQRKLAQGNVLGAANSLGISLSTDLRDQIAQTGYGSSFDAANQTFGNVLNQNDAYMRLGRVYNAGTSTDELIVENFGLGGGAEVTTKKRKLASAERAAFMGSSAVARGSLSARAIGQQ